MRPDFVSKLIDQDNLKVRRGKRVRRSYKNVLDWVECGAAQSKANSNQVEGTLKVGHFSSV